MKNPCKNCITFPACKGRVVDFVDIVLLEAECYKIKEYIHVDGYNHTDCFVKDAKHATQVINRIESLEKLYGVNHLKIKLNFVFSGKE